MQEATLSSRTLREPEAPAVPRKFSPGSILTKIRTLVFSVGVLLSPASTVSEAEEIAPVIPAGQGTLVIAGGKELPDTILDAFVDAAGGDTAKIIVITTASEDADNAAEPVERFFPRTRRGIFEKLHTRDPKEAKKEDFVKPITMATGVWFSGGTQEFLTDAYAGTLVQEEVHNLLKRGGAVGGTSAGAAIMGPVMIKEGNIVEGREMPIMASGLGFLRDRTIVDQHFTQRNRLGRLNEALRLFPDHYGYGIDEKTALIINPQGIFVMGAGNVRLCIKHGNADPDVTVYKDGDVIALPAKRQLAATPMEK